MRSLDDTKRLIIDTALSMGFQQAVVAGLEPMSAELEFYQDWLGRGYAASMEYLKRNPEKRNNPSLLYPDARCVILLLVPYYSPVPEDPGSAYGKVARYAVGRDYHLVIKEKLQEFSLRVEHAIGSKIEARAFTDDVDLFEIGLASRHGLGFIGKNSLLIGPKLSGSYFFLAEFFCNLELEPDLPYEGTCGNCFRCAQACPTDAIVEEKTVDANLCISFLTIENKGGIPPALREKVGDWVFGCDICQEICPYNQKPAPSVWPEFLPESGAGHFLNLFDVLKIDNKSAFLQKFGHTPLSRPRLRGLLRNALVVMGNRRPDGADRAIYEFLSRKPEEMLFEHGLWALRSCGGLHLINKLYGELEGAYRSLFEIYL